MSKSIKFKNDHFLDCSSIVYGRTSLNVIIEKLLKEYDRWNTKLPPNNDFNQAFERGLYLWNAQTINSPLGGNTYGLVFVFVSYSDTYNGVDNWLYQIAIKTDGVNGIYVRRKINANDFENWWLIT